jgi:DNA repair exonuclease SbcCD ATPase subunit
MIVFKKLTYKNFLSTGDQPTTIYLNKDQATLVVGQNGSGKSTMLDALSFGLFGKPHRSINKGQLVNSINNKNLLVTVDFSIGSIDYHIIRGAKPNKFEIYRNGKLLNQESHARDYQKILETNILKLNHKSFHQVVVLGSSNFVPFMQLSTWHRRQVIEELLDINVFTKMNNILKDKYNILRAELKETEHTIEILNEKIVLTNQHLLELNALDEEKKKELTEDIKTLEGEVNQLIERQKDLQDMINKPGPTKIDLDKLTGKRKKLVSLGGQIKGKVDSNKKQKKFFEENHSCPTCKQEMSQEMRTSSITELNKKIKETEDGINELDLEIEKVEKEHTDVSDFLYHIQSKASELTRVTGNITTTNSKISKLKEKVDKPSADTSKNEEELNNLKIDKLGALEKKSNQVEKKSYYDALYELLKDTGIKTKIIREYLPVMNNLINKYLQVLDFFVSFHLDENFDETIKSRYRDEFSYSSFSEGEKQRIDLALLFSWRQIAKMKNSANTNLLMLDETFDSSLDADGVDNLLKILYTLDDNNDLHFSSSKAPATTNTFIISHKQDLLDGKFPAKIEFEKQNNFSKIK